MSAGSLDACVSINGCKAAEFWKSWARSGHTDKGDTVSTPQPIRVLLAEDHAIVREGLLALLSDCGDIEVVDAVADGQSAVDAVDRLQPDVVVLDITMPRLSGMDATPLILQRRPGTRIIVLSMHAEAEYVRPVIRAGANGYITKGAGLSDLLTAIRAVHRGEAFFSPSIARIVLSDSRRESGANAREPLPGDALTNREREILHLVASGKSTPEIARLLSLSAKTVEGHRCRIMSKLDVHNTAGMILMATKLGLLERALH